MYHENHMRGTPGKPLPGVRKFGAATAEQCADTLSSLRENGRGEEVGALIIDCGTGEEFLAGLSEPPVH